MAELPTIINLLVATNEALNTGTPLPINAKTVQFLTKFKSGKEAMEYSKRNQQKLASKEQNR